MKRNPVAIGVSVIVSISSGAVAHGQSADGRGAAPGLVRQVKVMPDRAPDCSSLKAIAESVTRGCRSNDEKAVAIYNFMQLTHYHRQYPGEPGGLPVLKEINCYGWSLCGGLHAEQSAIWRELGWDWRFVGWNGHTTVEARYDDRWHYLDVFLKFYAWMPDGRGGRTIAGEDDLANNPQMLIRDAFAMDEDRGCVYMRDNAFVTNGVKTNWRAPEFLACGDTIDGLVGGIRTHRGSDRSEGWAGIVHANRDYSADVNLAPGCCLENSWDPLPDAWYWEGQDRAPAHTCGGHKDTRNDPGFGLVLEPYIDSKPARSYGNGTLRFSPDFSTGAVLGSFAAVTNVRHTGGALVPAAAGRPAAVVVELASPYILTQARGEAAGADKVEVSTDGGRTWQEAGLDKLTEKVKGRTAGLVRVTFSRALKALKLEAVVQNNPGALPYLSPGRNVIAVSVADPAALGDNQLVVTYGYRLGSRAKSFEQLCDQGKEIAKQHDAKWSDTVTCVRKVFAAGDLPGSFEIDCPTPAGRHPVYPRMMFLRREVIAPGSQPQPLPAGAIGAKLGAGDRMVSLPNPFLVGTEAPPVIKPRAVKTTRIPLRYVQYVDDRGEVARQETLRWPKNAGEQGKVVAGAVIVAGRLDGLPAAGLAAARLLVPVSQGHDKAAGKLGVVLLDQAVEPGQACEVRGLGDPVATTIIPRQPDGVPEYKPAKVFVINLTRALKAVAAGERKFHGLALRMVPDRGIDDGWTVRCDVSPGDEVVLEVDTLVE